MPRRFGLMLDEIDQESESRRVNTVFDLLDEVQRGRLGTDTARGSPGTGVFRRNLKAETLLLSFSTSLSDSARRVSVETQVSNVACTPTPGEPPSWSHPQDNRGQNGREVFALIAEYSMLRAEMESASGRATGPGNGSLSLMNSEARECSCFTALPSSSSVTW